MGEARQQETKRTRIVRPYPTHTLEDIHSIPSIIQDLNSGLPFDRILLAQALGTTASSSNFTMKLNSSAKYGLTQGGYKDDRISLGAIGKSLVAPTEPNERNAALITAVSRPEIFRRFYQILDGKRVPEDNYAINMIHRDLGVHIELAPECLKIVKANGLYSGIISNTSTGLEVNLSQSHSFNLATTEQSITDDEAHTLKYSRTFNHTIPTNGKILIGHSGSSEIVDFIKTALDELDIEYSVVESDYEDQMPLPDNVTKEMKTCTAAILVFAKPSWSRVSGGREIVGNEMMLYQLGAASVLYSNRIIALTEIGLDISGHTTGFKTIHFHRESLPEAALALLSELHRMGILQIKALPTSSYD